MKDSITEYHGQTDLNPNSPKPLISNMVSIKNYRTNNVI